MLTLIKKGGKIMGIGSFDEIDKKLVNKYKDIIMVNPELYKAIIENDSNFEAGNIERVSLDIYNDVSNIRQKISNLKLQVQNLNKHPRLNKDKLDDLNSQMQDLANPNNMYERLGTDILSITIGSDITPVVVSEILPQICVLRYKLTDLLGYIIPNVRILDSCAIGSSAFEINVRSRKVYTGTLSETDVKNKNVSLIINALQEVCLKYPHYIMSKTTVLKLMELVITQDPTLVNDLIPVFLSAIDLKIILANLIYERISIKDIILVFEILNDYARYTQDRELLSKILIKELSFASTN